MDIKDMQRGEWMPGDLKPEAQGVWEREHNNGHTAFSLWDGTLWLWASSTPEEAREQTMKSPRQDLRWRGQLEYDPHNAPQGFVAKPQFGCKGCESDNCDNRPIYCSECCRPDARSVIFKRAKP